MYGLDYYVKIQLFIPHCGSQKERWKLTFFCDYRLLNLKTVPDRHPISKILDALDNLSGVFSFESEKDISSDLFRRGRSTTYCIQHSLGIIRMGESTIWFDWCTNRILALTILENCLLDIRDEFALPYLDGVIVLSCNFTSHLEHLPIVFI